MLNKILARGLSAKEPPIQCGQAAFFTILPGIIASLITVGIWQLGYWQPFEQVSYNLLFKSRAALPHPTWDDRIVVIAIDEASLKQYGRFPWSRDRYQQLLQTLDAAQPDVVGFDVLFSEPTAQDANFAKALAMSGNGVLAIAADSSGKPISLVPALAQVTRQGHIDQRSGSDGITRHNNLYLNQFPSLGVAMLQVYNESMNNTVRSGNAPQLSQPVVLPISISNLPEQPAWINWVDNTAAVTTYSFADVAQGKVKPEKFANKIVLVGTTAIALDPLITPLNQTPPTVGLYQHVAVMDNVLNHRFLQMPPNLMNLLVLLGLGPLTSLILLKRGTIARGVLLLLLPGLWFSIALAAFYWHYLWLPIAAPVGAILLTGTGMELREQREKQLLMDLFSRYVAPETAKLLWRQKDQILQDGQIYGQELVATVLFMDIRDFTSISESLPPGDLLRWLNRYLDAMSNCIMDHGGVVDKYIGDAIMAVFGSPLPNKTTAEIQQDALNAIAASLAMHQSLQSLNQQLAIEGKPTIGIGIGVHTGVVVAGNMGGTRRMNYSVVGDTVNTAARLEAMNKEVTEFNPYNLLITAETLSCLNYRYQVKQSRIMQLRGRQQTTTIFSILGEQAPGKKAGAK